MPKKAQPAPQSLVASLRRIQLGRKARVSIGEIVAQAAGEGGLGPVLFLLTLPVLLPLPPGVSMVLSFPLLVVALQIVAGRPKVWLPEALARRSIDRSALVKLLRRILPLVARVEVVVRPRLSFLTGTIGVRVIGLACTLAAVVLILPIPFANLVPALTLGVFALGLTRKDGLLVLVGYGLVAMTAGVIVLGFDGILLGVRQLRTLF